MPCRTGERGFLCAKLMILPRDKCVKSVRYSAECSGLGLSEEFASVFSMEGNSKSSSEVILLNGGNMHIAQWPEGVLPHNAHLQLEDSRNNAQTFSKAAPSQYMKRTIGVCSSADTEQRSLSKSQLIDITILDLLLIPHGFRPCLNTALVAHPHSSVYVEVKCMKLLQSSSGVD